MELNVFITKTLSEIVEGVRNAEKDLKDDVALCYHTNKEYAGYPSVTYKYSLHDYQAPLTVVSFRVNVCVEEENSADGKVNAGVLSVFGASSGGKISSSSAEAHEVGFSLPLVWKKKDR